MDAERFKRILTAFADKPADVDLDRGRVLLQCHEDIIEADVFQREGLLYVKEGECEGRAEEWIVRRIARLPQLADRILDYIGGERYFVTPRARLLDELDMAPNESEVRCEDALECATEVLGRRPGGAVRILYLISDAGEGKTTLINEMARRQAVAYKNKEIDWLVVPISLGGRMFMRLDDVVIGSLMNRLRFQFLYYEAFLELVRMGVVVPALDGFEEMFVERASGEAVSALGNLLQSLGTGGTVLVAARRAYFEYRSFETQGKLFDSISSGSASFARLSLERWQERQFFEYCERREVLDARGLYQAVTKVLPCDHPVLTRAVLVRRLVDLASNASMRNNLITLLHAAPNDYFAQFVKAIIDREAEEKWIDRSGEPAQPLLSASEHQELLAAVALELWINSTDVLPVDVLDVVADLFCEGKGKPVAISRQIKERIKQHALIVCPDPARKAFGFDHEEFRHFFLGKGIAQYASAEGQWADLRNVLRVSPLPALAVDVATHEMAKRFGGVLSLVEALQRNCSTDGPSSFLSENCGAIISRLIDNIDGRELRIVKITFPGESLALRCIQNVKFEGCYFQPFSLHKARFLNVVFKKCIFERIELHAGMEIGDVVLDECSVQCVMPCDSERLVFDPSQIDVLLRRVGFSVPMGKGARGTGEPVEPDQELVETERAIRVFLRATEVNSNVFLQKLGQSGHFFMNEVMPRLLSVGIMGEVPYQGGGRQKRFKLTVEMSKIERALAHCAGKFDAFLRLANEGL